MKKNMLLSLVIFLFSSSYVFAGCGTCQADRELPLPKKSSSLVTTVPESGSIEGFVIASCGICNFDYKKKRGCSLTIKIGDTVYPVKGTSIKNHGNAHSKEGMCNVVRIAYASGTLKENVFYSDSFSLIESPE